ncbi:hypothetical protein F0562_012415 [Nyssa sinensis]|uniref:Cyclin N-terminal domain-containing protein n=1 Tax=Nyssa sinensis TaxID=561372 RepID=A0A5J4ZWG0_9ASTE|nr:hypothetical protein F0562_012415 [Nyssa sinensis]
MNKENRTAAKFEEPTLRITRARAKALGSSREFPPSKPFIKQDQKQALPPNSKRAASDENKPGITIACLQQKKRAVLKDVTNIFCDSSNINSVNATKIELSKQVKKGTNKKNAKVAPAILAENPRVQEEVKAKITQETSKLSAADLTLVKQTSSNHSQFQSPSKEEEGKLYEKPEASNGLSMANIDSNYKDPQMCSLYAPDIYDNLLVMELDRRPSVNYMEMLQRDITQSMRGILIDWLVEVSEEYRLVPDTLYLTVNLIRSISLSKLH